MDSNQLDTLLHFPSGRTVAQARKDAKRLAKAEGLPLHEALDRQLAANEFHVFAEGGLVQDWATAIRILTEYYEAGVRFPSAAASRKVPRGATLDLYSDATWTSGHYPWDEWERIALARGLSTELARLGRAVMRECHQHCWDPDLVDEVGHDSPTAPLAMLEGALADPAQLEARWRYLLHTDGERYFDHDTE